MENAWRADKLAATLRGAQRWAAVLVVAIGVGGCTNTSGFTEFLENLNKTLTSIAVIKKGGG
jgi:hypothetical protein